jgi:GTPase SAR1 family protein
MMQQIFSSNEGQPKSIRFVLYGLGGMGKTQIALKFLENVKQQ